VGGATRWQGAARRGSVNMASPAKPGERGDFCGGRRCWRQGILRHRTLWPCGLRGKRSREWRRGHNYFCSTSTGCITAPGNGGLLLNVECAEDAKTQHGSTPPHLDFQRYAVSCFFRTLSGRGWGQLKFGVWSSRRLQAESSTLVTV
jgi:hypothetical protein